MEASYRRRSENSYQLTVTLGFDYTGKRIRAYKTVHVDNDEDAAVEAKVFAKECEAQVVSRGSNFTLNGFIDMWRAEYAVDMIKISTLTVYDRMIESRFGTLLSKKLNTITHHDIQRWIVSLTRAGLSPKSVKNYYSLMHGILKKAVQWEYLSHNPADNIELPKSKPYEQVYYDEDDVKHLMTALSTVPISDQVYKVAVLLALFGGLRKGEFCGLDVDKVDFKNSKVTICKTRMVEVKNGVYEDTPKSLKSNRDVTLPSGVMDEIQKLIDYQEKQASSKADVWQGSGALLLNEVGLPKYPQTIYRWFKRFLKQHDLKDITLHQLRHTHVSMLFSEIDDDNLDASIQQISDRIGHQQKTTTLNIYSHLYKKSDADIAKRLNDKYFGA